MRTPTGTLTACLTMLALPLAPPASADPGVDFARYPSVSPAPYSLGQWLGVGFQTPAGFRCKLASHLAMSAVDCYGPFVGSPVGVHINSGSPGTAGPVRFSGDVPAEWADPARFDGHPLAVLPAGSALAGPESVCVHDERILLACRLGDPVHGRGFVATAAGTTVFGGE